jgi:hypothetical protein
MKLYGDFSTFAPTLPSFIYTYLAVFITSFGKKDKAILLAGRVGP